MKTKTLLLQFLLAFIFLFSTGYLNAQCPPFNTPLPCPGTQPSTPGPDVNQPSTPDKEKSPNNSTLPIKHIPLCPDCTPSNPPGGYYTGSGGGGIPSCVFDGIINTGNDIQIFPDIDVGIVAHAMVWDGECPSFSLDVTGDPNTQSPLVAAFVVELDRSNWGTISDPDIIIAQNEVEPNQIEILIVYEFSPAPGEKVISYEQWRYYFPTNYIELVPVTQSNNPHNILSEVDEIASNPNIDANNENKFAIAFESIGQIYSYVDEINSPTILNPNLSGSGRFIVSQCIAPENMLTPDVSISDNSGYEPVVSYVFNHHNDLHVVQDYYDDLDLLTFNNYALCRKNHLLDEYINPRISSPAYFDIYNEWECAITAVDIDYSKVGVFYNHNQPFGNFALTFLNSDPNSQQLLLNCDNTMPSITYTGTPPYDCDLPPEECFGGHSVAVAWTYDDCTSPYYISGTKDVVSVTLSLQNNARKPNLPDYFMMVNTDLPGDQYASSVAGEGHTNFAGDIGEVFYSVGSSTPDKMIYKMSNTTAQPWLRKKFSGQGEQTNEKLKVFPNPSNGKLNIELPHIKYDGPVEVAVFAMDGRKVFEKVFTSKIALGEIDLSGFEPGIYFIDIRAGSYSAYEKISISK